MTYQRGKPQLDECENAKGASLPAIALLPMLLPSASADPRDESLGKNAQLALAGGCPPQISHSRDQPGAEEKFFCPGTRFAVIPLIIEVIRYSFGFSEKRGYGLYDVTP
ncbi:MAG: hypothetical protein J7M32_05410 [Deltaproteobacteria bacterium]|nr:hypothetical protein [Deltaproteobacteria bacterium]